MRRVHEDDSAGIACISESIFSTMKSRYSQPKINSIFQLDHFLPSQVNGSQCVRILVCRMITEIFVNSGICICVNQERESWNCQNKSLHMCLLRTVKSHNDNKPFVRHIILLWQHDDSKNVFFYVFTFFYTSSLEINKYEYTR